MTSEAQHPSRLTGVLEERNAPVERLLASAQAAGPNNVFLGIAGLSRRLELLLPVHPAVLEVVAPGIAIPGSGARPRARARRVWCAHRIV